MKTKSTMKTKLLSKGLIAMMIFILPELIWAQPPTPIDPTIIPQFVDPLPHFAAGLRVNAKAGGNLIVKAVASQQVAVSTGTILTTGTVGTTTGAGLGTYFTYSISKDGGATFTPPLWPSFTIEAQQGYPLNVTYRNELYGNTYADVNILVDQTLMHDGVPHTGNDLVDPYTGPIPMSPHLHGGEVESASDGGPLVWFTPGYAMKGSEFVDSVYHYPNSQEPATLWYHEHSSPGLTRVNVIAGMEGFYFLRGTDEEIDQLPGWSGDDLVKEVTPAGATTTFNANAYLPDIEVAIQDRMFNDKGELYYTNDPPNPSIHPFWTPEFFGDIMCVNGKTWPYLSVAPRKYRFHILNGCNARFLNMWLQNLSTLANGPVITVVGTDGGLLDAPVVLDPATGARLFISPGERNDIIIDFTGVAPGTVFTLMNDAAAPYPSGDPIMVGLTDRIMQFVVNGTMQLASNPINPGTDLSNVPSNLRATPLVKLTDFNGATTITPGVKRQMTLNEVMGSGGPAEVLINNINFMSVATETPLEGTTELWQVINTTADAHPMHIHLVQFQLVSRQDYDAAAYDAAYAAAFSGGTFIGSSGPPMPYSTINSDGAIGGNPSITPFLLGAVIPANPEEMGWKDVIKAFPGQIATYIVRFAPTSKALAAPVADLVYPFDPSTGPGYVWHCHIVEHEDNDMMRPLDLLPSSARYPIASLGNDTTLTNCLDSLVLTAQNNGSTYLWNTGATCQTIKVGGGTFYVLVTNTDGYSDSDTIIVTKNIIPVTVHLGPDTTVCECLALYAGNQGSNYYWNTGGNYPTITACTSGAYWVTVSNGTCIGSDTINVTINNEPVVNLGPDLTGTGPFLLDAGNAGSNFLWNTGSTTQTITASLSGTYFVTVTNGPDCFTSDTININNVTGVAEMASKSSVDIFPNPGDGHLTVSITSPEEENFSIKIYNELGELMVENNDVRVKGVNNHPLNMSAFPSGIYSVEIKNAKEKFTKQIVINK